MVCVMRKKNAAVKKHWDKEKTVGGASSLVDAEDSGELDLVAAMRVASAASGTISG